MVTIKRYGLQLQKAISEKAQLHLVSFSSSLYSSKRYSFIILNCFKAQAIQAFHHMGRVA